MQTGVLCYPNPVNLYINEVAIGISSVDVIFHLSSEEASRGLTDNRINRLAGYLLDQRSFYPLFPPRPGTQLELPRLKQLDIPVTPDLMLLPSNLAPFAKEVDGVLCVNPGKLTKAQQGGTYTKLSIFPIKKSGKIRALHVTFSGHSICLFPLICDADIPSEDTLLLNRVADRTKVEVIKI